MSMIRMNPRAAKPSGLASPMTEAKILVHPARNQAMARLARAVAKMEAALVDQRTAIGDFQKSVADLQAEMTTLRAGMVSFQHRLGRVGRGVSNIGEKSRELSRIVSPAVTARG